jgi:hypothetical protein
MSITGMGAGDHAIFTPGSEPDRDAYISDMGDRVTGKWGLCVALLIGACAGGQAPVAMDPSTNAGNAGGAAITAAAAAALWAAGGGCKLQGCPYGSYCNHSSGFCDVRKCSDPGGCPDGTVCNEGLDRCQMAPPPNTPNDFLPQDSVRAPPGQH